MRAEVRALHRTPHFMMNERTSGSSLTYMMPPPRSSTKSTDFENFYVQIIRSPNSQISLQVPISWTGHSPCLPQPPSTRLTKHRPSTTFPTARSVNTSANSTTSPTTSPSKKNGVNSSPKTACTSWGTARRPDRKVPLPLFLPPIPLLRSHLLPPPITPSPVSTVTARHSHPSSTSPPKTSG